MQVTLWVQFSQPFYQLVIMCIPQYLEEYQSVFEDTQAHCLNC